MNIAIAGAGIMGRLLAWQLTGQGHQISLFDKDPIDGGSASSYTAAGMLAPYSELESADNLIYQLGQCSLQLWPGIVKDLDAQKSFYQRGSLVVAHPQDAAELQRFKLMLQSKLPEYHQSCCSLTQSELAELEPDLAEQFTQATMLADEAWLHNDEIMAALAEKLLQHGARWNADTQVTSLAAGEIITTEKTFSFDWVIDCRGLGARNEVPKLRGVRGELIWVQAPDVNISRMVRLMHPRYRLYLVPRGNQQYILGATQIESEDYSPISVRSMLELLSALYTINPGFAEARIIVSKTNCRPALMDNKPCISIGDGLIRVNGLFRHGFMLAPVLAAGVVNYLASNTASPRQFPEIYNQLTTGESG
jgi:glycine oxidase